MSLQGKVAVVTGGSRGIGRGICLALAAEGANIAVNYASNAQAATEAVQKCREAGSEAIAIQGNVAVASDVQTMFQAITKHFGRIDILVNNAGVETVAPLDQLKVADWDYVFDVNVKGIFLCSQQVIPAMRAQGRGVIVNITSICGQQVWTGYAHYCASKAAADMLTKCMAVELAPFGISVNAIAPGTVDTEMTRADLDKPGELDAVIRLTPTKRLGTPEDIARMVVFLCDRAGDWLTGEVIAIDGGYRLPGDPLPDHA